MSEPFILCVDDDQFVLESLVREIQREFRDEATIVAARSGEEALELIREMETDGYELALTISDQRMPHMEGSELLTRLKESHPDAVRIMLTGFSDIDALRRAVNDADIYLYVSKPWSPTDLALSCRRGIEERNHRLLNMRLTRQLESATKTVMSVLESIIDFHDPETYEHIQRVSSYAAIIAHGAGCSPVQLRKIFVYAPLHDLGKIGIPREILVKPGPLDDREMEEMRRHVNIGADLLERFETDPELLEIVRFHHERWDGKGYATGLAGEEIPLPARIVAIADVFDAVLSDRPYKKSIPFDDAVTIIRSGKGTQFDPRLVDAFEKNLEHLQSVFEGEDENVTKRLLGID